jgi:phosphodiesterase/alkaline phosphatase D-like protein
VTADGIVLWTRLAPEPANPAAMGRSAVPVGWRVARDSGMRNVVARGVAVAHTDLAHSVHVEVDGLLPARDYFYQFDAGREESAIAHFRTAPSAHEMAREIRFAFATCQDWPSGYYTAYPLARQRLLNDVVSAELRNPVFLTGDWHSTFRQRSEARLQRHSRGAGRHRVRDAGDYHRRRRHALRPVLRADDSVQSAHQVLRRRQARVFQGDRHG